MSWVKKINEWLDGVGVDKYLHVLAGLIITQLAIALFGEPWIGFIIGVVAGVLKETVDENAGGSFDLYDLLATVIGSGIGLVLIVVQ